MTLERKLRNAIAKARKRKTEYFVCEHCGEMFKKGFRERCPDHKDHAAFGIKCCHWSDIPAEKPKSALDRKRQKQARGD
jgi:hypothetical protein